MSDSAIPFHHFIVESSCRRSVSTENYKEKLNYAKGVYFRNSRHVPDVLIWSEVDRTLRDVFVDTIYRGNRTAPERVKIMARGGNQREIIKYLKKDPLLSGNSRRNEIRIKALSK